MILSTRLRWLAVALLTPAIPIISLISGPASAAEAPVGLGTASSFAVLAGTTVTNTGPSIISGDLGVSPGTAITGFPPGTVINGAQHSADAVALQAQSDLTTAYNDAAGRGPAAAVSSDLGGQTLVGGVYSAASAMGLTGTVTLDGQNDPDSVFIFQAGSTLITASSSTVALINGTQPCNVFWQVGSSATLGTDNAFVGTIMALTSVSVQTGTTVTGRVLARNGQVSLDTNTITQTDCATPPTTTTTTTGPPSSTTTTTGPPSSTTTTTGPPSSTTTTTSPSGDDDDSDDDSDDGSDDNDSDDNDDNDDDDSDDDSGQYDGGDDEEWDDSGLYDDEYTEENPSTDDAGNADSLGTVNNPGNSAIEPTVDGKVDAETLAIIVVPPAPPSGVLTPYVGSLPVTGAGRTVALVMAACLLIFIGTMIRRTNKRG